MVAQKKVERGRNERPSAKPAKRAIVQKQAASNKTAQNSTSAVIRTGEVVPLQRPSPGSFPIVGIGASAGGLEAFEQFFSNMPPDSGMAFVLIPHLDPMRKTILPDLLQRYSKMPFTEAQEGMEIEQNHVYVIPPNKDISILSKRLFLLEPTISKGIRHPIDFFFRSLAEDQRENAICIILSGTGTEGSLGLRAVKGEGGLVLVQEPKDAKYDGMPSSAIASGLVDDVLPASRMPERLLAYTRHTPRELPAAEKPEGKGIDPLKRMFTLIRNRTGHDFSLYKKSTIMRRIERRMTLLQLGDIKAYVGYLEKNTQEIEILFKEILIRVTHFFRDRDAFEALKSKALPIITKDKSYDHPVRIWVPGCSTGEEAYSLAIMLNEYASATKQNFKSQIFATDIDSGAIDIARTGQYANNIAVDVSPKRLERYFQAKGNTYKIKDEIREMIVFSVQNLAKDPPFSKLDLISCRNLLIYLETDLQKRIMPILHYALNPGGVLFLGPSENAGSAEDGFNVLDMKWKIYLARNVESLAPVMLDLHAEMAKREVKPRPVSAEKVPRPLKVNELSERFLLDQYSPPAALVNEKGDILYIHGRTGKFLEPAPGRTTLNIIDMAREGLRPDLRAALRKAMKEKKKVRIDHVRVKSNGSFEIIDLDVSYITTPEHPEGLIMVAFRPVAHTPIKEKPVPKGKTDRKITARMDELEFELKSTKEHLQSTIEELETSNEELKSTNEELQSSNEELQSTNEELESSKEELQSVNEELMTVNAEHQGKIDEMAQASNDMANLTANTEIAIIFLDNDLHIKSFTPAIKNIFNLIESDIGRPISDIVSKLDYPDLVNDIQDVIRTLSVKEKTVEHPDRAWYLCRILPYRTLNNMIAGAVITFVDITEQKKARVTEQALAFNRGIIETIREPLLILDASLKVISANNSFFRMFGVTASATEGKPVYELGNRQWDIPKLRELLEKILPQRSEFNDYDVEHDFPGIGLRRMRLNARRITHGGAETETILLAIEDVTGK